jgi:hypothetical protein
MDETLIPLGLVEAPCRQHMVALVLREISRQRVPRPRVVKRVRSRYEHKKPEHGQAPPLELDLSFHEIIALVT